MLYPEHKLFVDPRTVLREFGLRPKQSFGQNFLISEKAVETIARLCVDQPGRRVLEIGPGLGTLTHALLILGGSVIAVERDRDMCAVLRAAFGEQPHFKLEEADAARFDYDGTLAAGPGVIAGNLPYQITGRIMRQIIDAHTPPLRAVFMVQEEVADRLKATEQDKPRGALSAMVQLRYDVRVALRLSPKAFVPPPKVRSAVVVLTPHPSLDCTLEERRAYDTVVKMAFSKRRKTLRNALMGLSGIGTEGPDALLEAAAVDGRLRAEKLTNEDFLALGRAYLALEKEL